MKKIFFMLGVAAMMTACSQDEVLDINNEANAIKVGVDVAGASRASDSYCPEVLPENFNFSAVTTDGTLYFLNDPMKHGKGTAYSFVNGSRYWTESALDFYAWHCTQTGVNFSLAQNEEGVYEGKFTDFTVAENAENQADLIFAKTAEVQPGTDVFMTFKHALAQVCFKAKCENQTINVDIKGVGLYGLYNQGTFTWTGATGNNSMLSQGSQIGGGNLNILQGLTDGGIENAGEGNNENLKPTYGWVVADNAATTNYFVNLDATATVNSTTDVVTLTGAPADHTNKEGWAKVFQLLPQSYKTESNIRDTEDAGNLSMVVKHNVNAMNAEAVEVPELKSQAYIMLQCEITTTNAAGETIVLYGATDAEGNAQYVYIPFEFTWVPGFRYVYTINFTNEGNGGVTNPEPDPEDPEKPLDPVLKGIRVNGTVLEYNEVDGGGYVISAGQSNQGVLSLLG